MRYEKTFNSKTSRCSSIMCCYSISMQRSNRTTNSNAEASSTASAKPTAAVSSTKAANTDLIKKVEYAEDDMYTDWSSSNPTEIKLNGTSASINGSGAEAKESTVTITAAGTYVVSGKLDNGQIAINVKDKGIVRLVLNGAEIYNSSTSAIFVEEAGRRLSRCKREQITWSLTEKLTSTRMRQQTNPIRLSSAKTI